MEKVRREGGGINGGGGKGGGGGRGGGKIIGGGGIDREALDAFQWMLTMWNDINWVCCVSIPG